MKQNLRNDLTYRRVGDYLLPELEVPEGLKVGVWSSSFYIPRGSAAHQVTYPIKFHTGD